MKNDWGSDSIQLFKDIVPELRKQYKPDDIELMGTRFNNDNFVLFRMQEAVTEKQFKAEPLTSVTHALSECASRDHYYATEKAYE